MHLWRSRSREGQPVAPFLLMVRVAWRESGRDRYYTVAGRYDLGREMEETFASINGNPAARDDAA